MSHINVTGILDTEKTRLDGILADTTISNYRRAQANRCLDLVDNLYRQRANETEADYTLRMNMELQAGIKGEWSNSFFQSLEAAFQADTGQPIKSGLGRTPG